METAILTGALLAAGLLMASGVWVCSVLVRTLLRIKRPAASAADRAAANPMASGPGPAQS